MKYIVAELDAMPVGTMLMNHLVQCIKTRDKLYPWRAIERVGSLDGEKRYVVYTQFSSSLSHRNFTHRADPAPIGDEHGR